MGDGRALQAATSHDLRQNFARAFDITFLDENQDRVYRTRPRGGFPRVDGGFDPGPWRRRGPRVAARGSHRLRPSSSRSGAARTRERCAARPRLSIRNFRLRHQDGGRPRRRALAGWKFNEHELRGVPVRVELEAEDIEKEQAVLVRRDTGEKEFVGEGIARAARDTNGRDPGEYVASGDGVPRGEHPQGRKLRGVRGDHRQKAWFRRRPPGTARRRPSSRSRKIRRLRSGSCPSSGRRGRTSSREGLAVPPSSPVHTESISARRLRSARRLVSMSASQLCV